jgi:hypothetical protein
MKSGMIPPGPLAVALAGAIAEIDTGLWISRQAEPSAALVSKWAIAIGSHPWSGAFLVRIGSA